MRTISKPLPWIAVILITGCATGAYLWSRPTTAEAAPVAGSFAVVELFTSEGCSSCPPADAALAKIVDESKASGGAVYAMEFHVDYWNRLGWTDPFSDASYSKRQVDYSNAMRLQDVYTPQMVVNGTTQFNGSDQDTAKRAINKALAAAPAGQISLTPKLSADGKGYDVSFATKGLPASVMVNIVLVERDVTTQVTRGENDGRTLRHRNVVRSFKAALPGADGNGVVHVEKVEGVAESNTGLIAYVQAADQGSILAATSADVPGAK